MNDPSSTSPDQPEAALLAVERDYPGWVAWHGTIPMFYARLLKSSPPIVVRAPDLLSLRARIEGALKGRES